MTAVPILDAILRTLPDNWRGEELVIGQNWTMAVLIDPLGQRHAGLAATPAVQGGFTADSLVDTLAQNIYSANPAAVAVGIATLNAFLQPPPELLSDIDAADWLVAQGKGRKIALVGRFPFIDELRPIASQLWVLELDPRADEIPASDAARIIPQAEIVAITSSTLVNRTLDGLLALVAPDAKVMMLGPTTPLTPILFDYGVHLLSGVQVVDIEATLADVSQGLIFRHMKGLRRVTLCR